MTTNTVTKADALNIMEDILVNMDHTRKYVVSMIKYINETEMDAEKIQYIIDGWEGIYDSSYTDLKEIEKYYNHDVNNVPW